MFCLWLVKSVLCRLGYYAMPSWGLVFLPTTEGLETGPAFLAQLPSLYCLSLQENLSSSADADDANEDADVALRALLFVGRLCSSAGRARLSRPPLSVRLAKPRPAGWACEGARARRCHCFISGFTHTMVTLATFFLKKDLTIITLGFLKSRSLSKWN